ncbi:helix-turn-helix domain-containing protein [Candidatus Omnitrophota bacterium]
MKKLLSVPELAGYLNISKNTVYSWVYMKQIPYYKVGRLVRFDIKEIDQWLGEKKQEAYPFQA